MSFTPFARWALALPVESFRLPRLTAPTEDELVTRSFDISFDLCEQTDDELANLMIQVGGLNYLEALYEKDRKTNTVR